MTCGDSSGRPLVSGRGLKHALHLELIGSWRRPLVSGRGLKHTTACQGLWHGTSPARERAWIETNYRLN